MVTGHKYSGYIKYEELNFIEATISSSISDKLKITDSDRPKQLNNELQEPKLEVKNPMKSKIENYFSFMLKNDFRKHQQILTETDFEKLIDWLTLYFENNFTIPEITEPIKTINTAKGNVITSYSIHYTKLYDVRIVRRQPGEGLLVKNKCPVGINKGDVCYIGDLCEPLHDNGAVK